MVTPILPGASSPKWGSTAKLIVGLTFAAIIIAFVSYSRSFIGPLLLVFILTYLLHPLTGRISQMTHLSWRVSVNLIFLVLVALIVATFTVAGLAIFQQIQNLVLVVQNFIQRLPEIASHLSSQVYTFGPFQLNLAQFDLQTISQELLTNVQPLLTRVTGLFSSFASGAASLIGWGLFVLLISYFIMVDASPSTDRWMYVEVPGYDADVRRLLLELRHIWNAFLRGQIIIFVLIVLVYTILMTILGVRYAFAIAILAGLAKFVPYLGPLTTWTVTALVTIFQGSNYFGLQQWQYTILVIVLALIADQIFDNLVSPRLIGQTMGIHPAVLLIGAFLAANVIGIIGLVVSAPVLATLKLLGTYAIRKMLDLDPWPQPAHAPTQVLELPVARAWNRTRAWYRSLRTKKNS